MKFFSLFQQKKNTTSSDKDSDTSQASSQLPDEVRVSSAKPSKRHSDGFALIICVFIAICTWFYVMKFDSPIFEKEFSNVPIVIDVSSLQNSISVINDEAMYADVKVRGKKSDINRLTVSDLVAYADVSDITEAGTYTKEVKFTLPNGISIASQYPENVSIYLEKRISKTLPISVNLTNYTVAANYILGENNLTTENVLITGPESVLNTITKATVTIEGGNISESFKSNGKIQLLNENNVPVNNKYVYTNISDVTVGVNVYTYKNLKLDVQYKYNFYNDSNVNISISPQYVRVKGLVEDLRQRETLTVATIDEKKISADGLYVYSIPTEDNLEIEDGITNANVTITHIGLATDVITTSNITTTNIPSGIHCNIDTSYLNITLRGDANAISQIKPEDVNVIADLSNQSGASGTIYVPVTVSVKVPGNATVYEVGDYRIEVTLS